MHLQAPRALPQGATVEEMDAEEHARHGGGGQHQHHVQEPDDDNGHQSGGGIGGGGSSNGGACILRPQYAQQSYNLNLVSSPLTEEGQTL